MIYIDKYAYFSALASVKPELKIIFGILALIVCICSNTILAFGFIFCVMLFFTIFKARIPIVYYLKLLALPLSFLILSVIAIVVDVKFTPDFSARISDEGLKAAVLLICKSMSAVSCLYFIILTTPIRDIISFLHYLHLPKPIITLTTLIYRFIFLIMEIAVTKLKSQQCRHGYARSKGFTKSFGMLWGSVFVQSLLNGEWIYKAMQVRGHDENVKFISRKMKFSAKEIALMLVFGLLAAGMNFI